MKKFKITVDNKNIAVYIQIISNALGIAQMAITVKEPLDVVEVDIELAHSDYLLLKRIREKCSLIDAIVVLRKMYKNVGLKQAKEFCETL